MNTSHRNKLFGAGLLLLVVAAIGFFSLQKAPKPNEQDKLTPFSIRIGYPPVVASLPLLIAQENHLFPNGLTANATLFANSNDMLNALVANQLDILPAVSLIPILHLEIQHPGTVRLFSHSRMRPEKAFDSIIVKDSSPIRALADLAGKKIGVFPGTSASNLLKAFLKKHGVPTAEITVIQLAPPSQMASLQSGAVDALFTYEPITTTAAKLGGYRSIFGSVYADLLNPCPVGVSVISRRFEKEHPAAAKEAIESLDRAVVIQRSKLGSVRPLIEKLTKIPPDIAAAVNVVDVTLSTENDTANLQAFIDLLYEVGEIPEQIKAERLLAPSR